MSRKIEVVPYNPIWPEKYQTEAWQIEKIFKDNLIAIHHIGSTAIPSIKAKPVIDIMVIVQDIEKVAAINPAMIRLGYIPRGEYGIRGRRYFNKNTSGVRSHHVHIYALGNPEIDFHLDFRDYLRAHPTEAQAYSNLKEGLASQYRYDSEAYSESKTEFVKRILELAGKWRLENPPTQETD
ncbi:MAG: GrpB family protein [Gammaproteobacteria bacterium]|nr:GrpB family protein [Gammaproteobacteria bacterium]